MNSLPFALLIVILWCNRLSCGTGTTTENVRVVRRSLGMSMMGSDENRTEGREMSWKDALFGRKIPVNVEEMKTVPNARVDSSNRRTKILGSLAFLASLANAASAPTKAYVKSPPVHLYPDVSRLSPHIAPIYDPHVYVPHPYILTTPLGFYSLLNLLRLQSIGGVQNEFQALTQNPQVLNLLEDKKPIDLLSNNDKYMDETKRVENVKTPSSVQEEADESVGLQVENVRNAEEKATFETACETQKRYNKKQGNLKLLENEDEDENERKASRAPHRKDPHSQNLTNANATTAGNDTSSTTASSTTTSSTTTSSTNAIQNSTMSATQNSTMNNTDTATPPFYGYYGGYPQNVNHIDFTTETHDYKYHDYDQVHYNLPSYDKAVNFYSDDKYNYYANPTADSFSANQFQQDPIPEILSSDFSRFLYTPENPAPFINGGFRPVA